jgi:trimeric autotransporter adhesin
VYAVVRPQGRQTCAQLVLVALAGAGLIGLSLWDTADAPLVGSTSAAATLGADYFAYLRTTVSPLAGTGAQATTGDGGAATSAALNSPGAIAFDAAGDLYVCEAGGANVRMIDTNGTITSPIGSSVVGFSGDGGSPSAAKLNSPRGVAIASDGTIYVADSGNNRIRAVSGGVITTVAGTGVAGFAGDGGPATAAQLSQPRGLAVAPDGSLYVADAGNHVVRRISTNGTITTVAGTGTAGDSGDGGPATAAAMQSPFAVAFGAGGTFYVVDRDAHRVRRITGGVITTMAGTGTPGAAGTGGPATSAQLNGPSDVILDAAGALYIADSSNSRVVKVDPTMRLRVIAGTGTSGSSGDGGQATSAQFQFPRGLAFRAVNGNLYVSDQNANRVRVLTP